MSGLVKLPAQRRCAQEQWQKLAGPGRREKLESSSPPFRDVRRVNLSPSPCLARVKAMEAAGVIERYVALVNVQALHLGLNVFISICLTTQSEDSLAVFERRIAEHDEVMECYLATVTT